MVKNTGEETVIIDGREQTRYKWDPIQFDGQGNAIYGSYEDSF